MPYWPSETTSASWKALSGSPTTCSPAALARAPALRQVVFLHQVRQHFVFDFDLARTASLAISSVVAATAAISMPCH